MLSVRLCDFRCGSRLFRLRLRMAGNLRRPAYDIVVGGKGWSWIGDRKFLLRGIGLDGSAVSLVALFGMFSVAFAALIPLGTGADRWRLAAICGSTALMAGWTYPVFAHWVWGGGWLAQLAMAGGMGRGFVDTAVPAPFSNRRDSRRYPLPGSWAHAAENTHRKECPVQSPATTRSDIAWVPARARWVDGLERGGGLPLHRLRSRTARADRDKYVLVGGFRWTYGCSHYARSLRQARRFSERQ